MQNHYKRRYHPLVILLYHSKMLSPDEIAKIPRTTLNEWKHFSHEDYFGYEFAKDYIDDFEYIKEVLTKKHLNRGMKILCSLSNGYRKVISQIESNKKLLRGHAEQISYSIRHFASVSRLSITDASAFFGVSRDWFYRYRKKKSCEKSVLNRCIRQFPNQLTIDEVTAIEQLVTDPKHFNMTKTSLYYHALRKGLIFCGRSTFFKYADLSGYKKTPKAMKTKQKKGFQSTRPFEWLHVDVTQLPTLNNGIQYVAFIRDHFSGAPLHYISTPHPLNSGFIRELFIQTFNTHHLWGNHLPINILSDGGPENKGSLIEWINQIESPPVVSKLTAQTEQFHFSNSMSESLHRLFKTYFLRKKIDSDRESHLQSLEDFMDYMLNKHYLSRNYGLTTAEVLQGNLPDKSLFQQQIKLAKIKRIEINRQFNQCPAVCFHSGF